MSPTYILLTYFQTMWWHFRITWFIVGVKGFFNLISFHSHLDQNFDGFFIVDWFMIFQCGLFWSRIATNIAFEWFFTLMDCFNMTFQIILRSKFVSTQWAMVWFLLFMNCSNMRLHIEVCRKRFSTSLIRALVWLLLLMNCFEMEFHIRSLVGSVITILIGAFNFLLNGTRDLWARWSRACCRVIY